MTPFNVSMATSGELLRCLGNEDIGRWLQLQAWSQSLLLTRTPGDVIQPPAGVPMTTTRDVIAAVEKDGRFLSPMTGKC